MELGYPFKGENMSFKKNKYTSYKKAISEDLAKFLL
jgi:hypothetical protein